MFSFLLSVPVIHWDYTSIITVLIFVAVVKSSDPFPVCDFNLPGKCLVFDDTLLLTYEEAEDYCKTFNFSVASVTTQTDSSVLRKILGFNDSWLRFRKNHGDSLTPAHKKLHGESSCSTDSCCRYYMTGDGYWSLDLCDSKHGIICEKSVFLDSLSDHKSEKENDEEANDRLNRRGKSLPNQRTAGQTISPSVQLLISFFLLLVVGSLTGCVLIRIYQRIQSQAYHVTQI